MSEEKNMLEEIVAALKKLLGFGTDEQITSAVNGIVDAKGDETGVMNALQGLFGDAIGKADLLAVVKDFLGKGAGIDLGNILELFQGIGDHVGGFDKVAALVGGASAADEAADAAAGAVEAATDAGAGVAGAAADAVAGAVDSAKGLAGDAAGAVSDAAGAAADAAKGAVGSVTGAVKGAAGSVTGAVKEASGSVSGALKDAAGGATGAVKGAAGAAAGAAGAAAGAVKGVASHAADAAAGAVDGVKQVAAEPARKRKKWPIVVGVLAAVIALAGVGMWIWHEQPSFCASFCHTSMDAYLETYSQEDNKAGVDKYGNNVANTHAMLAVSHASRDMTCLSCHIPAIDQQIGEVVETITGNYTVIERVNGNGYALHEATLSELQDNAHLVNDSGKGDEFCLRSGCHDFTREVLATATESMAFNPHVAQHGEIACGECHKSHRASVLYCTQCHSEAAEIMPEGWLTYQEGQAANVA